jgi:chlorite dismutase
VASPAAPVARLFSFVAGGAGAWRVDRIAPVAGESLPKVSRISVIAGDVAQLPQCTWLLRGITSNERYVIRAEKAALASKPESVERRALTRAALIPVRKNAAWWALPQDERRHIFEAQSRHIEMGLKYAPAVVRRLHHCRDLGPDEPFDFLTWFEYAPADAAAFEELVRVLRASPEWAYVEREVDIRLVNEIGHTRNSSGSR